MSGSNGFLGLGAGMNGSNGIATFDANAAPPPMRTGYQPPAFALGGEGGESEVSEFFVQAFQSGAVDVVKVARVTPQGLVPINRFPIGATQPSELSDKIWKMCANNARALGREGSYQIEVCVTDQTSLDGVRTVATHALFLQSSTPASGFSEPPNQDGLVSQIMRHKEGDNTIKDRMIVEMFRMMQTELRRKDERIVQLEALEVTRTQQLEQLMVARVDEQGRLERHKARGEAEKVLLGELTKLIPIAINMGVSYMATKESTVFQRLTSFMQSLTKEQQNKVAEILSPDQQIQLFDMMNHPMGGVLRKLKNGEALSPEEQLLLAEAAKEGGK